MMCNEKLLLKKWKIPIINEEVATNFAAGKSGKKTSKDVNKIWSHFSSMSEQPQKSKVYQASNT